MGETETTAGVCEAIPAALAADWLKAANDEIPPADATKQNTSKRGSSATDIKIVIWAPALATEPTEMILAWAKAAARLMTGVHIVVIFNGPGSEQVAHELWRDAPPEVQICALPGAASIGRAQQFVMQQFLRTNEQVLARIDPDGQFPLSSLIELCHRLVSGGPDVVVAQRDEASASGRIRFLGNVALRLVALRLGMFADLNSGCYVMNRRAAAVLCQVPLPKYPEPRMLAWLRARSVIT